MSRLFGVNGLESFTRLGLTDSSEGQMSRIERHFFALPRDRAGGRPRREPLSRNNHAHLKDKSSVGQSLSVALSASCGHFDRNPRDRNGPEETMTQTRVISQKFRMTIDALPDEPDALRDKPEFAVSVAEAWRRKTLATLLVGVIASRAKALGLRYLVGDVFHSNQAMIALARKSGFAVTEPIADARLVKITKDLLSWMPHIPRMSLLHSLN
jgi:GNAT superfamily N-acetyltransferase